MLEETRLKALLNKANAYEAFFPKNATHQGGKMNTVAGIFYDSLRPLKLVTILLYGILTFSFYLRSDGETDVALMTKMAPWWIWSSVSAFVTILRIIGLAYSQGPFLTRVIVPVFGIVFWCMLLAAAFEAQHFGFGLLYIVCAFIEAWFLARAIVEKRAGK